jgi:hypothetical protein
MKMPIVLVLVGAALPAIPLVVGAVRRKKQKEGKEFAAKKKMAPVIRLIAPSRENQELLSLPPEEAVAGSLGD